MKLFVSPCIMKELRGLPEDEFRTTATAARALQLHHCGCSGAKSVSQKETKPSQPSTRRDEGAEEDEVKDDRVEDKEAGTASDCLLSQVGSSNPNHWWIATQDKTLRERLGSIPGTPILFVTVHGLHVETPSEMARAAAREEEEESRSLPSHERRSEVLKDLEQIRPKLLTSVRFRRNKAKGPNPLAMKKKIKKVEGGGRVKEGGRGVGRKESGGEEGGGDEVQKKKRPRKRRKGGE